MIIAATPEGKRTLAEHLRTHDPELLAVLQLLGSSFGPLERVILGTEAEVEAILPPRRVATTITMQSEYRNEH